MLELKVIKPFTPLRPWANGRIGGSSKRPTVAVCRCASVSSVQRLSSSRCSRQIQRPKTCEECGATGKIEAAHFNYDEPLRIRWLCCSCHRHWDKREPKNGTFVERR